MAVVLEKSNKMKSTVNDLKLLIANSYVLYVKTQNFHWNVKGPRFHQLHLFFETLYKELAEAIDEIAEQVRALQDFAPATMKEFLQLTTIEESPAHFEDNRMLEILLSDHVQIQEDLKTWIHKAQESGDEATADLMIDRLRAHDKAIWMIRSHLQ